METQVHRGMRTLLSLMAATALSVALARPASSSEAQAPNASAPATSRNAPASSAGAAKRPAGSRPSAGLSLAPWDGKGNFIAYYQDVTGAGEAPLITLDAAAWMLLRLREEALSATELFALAPRLKEGVEALAVQVRKLAPPPALAPAHKRLLAYLGVAQALLDPKAAPPAGVEKEVSEELARIEAHKGFEFSAVLDQKMDYSQMAPRGKYAASRRQTLSDPGARGNPGRGAVGSLRGPGRG
ncbi:MAG: DUF3160 domain-containing protein [Candidatus Sumerlaeota bacterium]|nr:DUF3160 domain-containing protein [Candidatus Sumerlaeota bacterium]